jgi:hypothetical protein
MKTDILMYVFSVTLEEFRIGVICGQRIEANGSRRLRGKHKRTRKYDDSC